MRFFTFVAFLTVSVGFLWSEEPSPLDTLPGYYQFAHGDPLEGSLTAGGFVLSVGGLLVATQESSSSSAPEYWVEKEGRHYFRWIETTNEGFQSNRIVSGLGLGASLWGSYFYAYGSWKSYLNLRGSDNAKRQLGLSMLDYLGAPFNPDNVFNTDVLPVLPLLTLGSVSLSNYEKVGAFFSKDSVNFAGFRVSPWAGLGLTAATSLAIVAANATLEEILFRGMMLDRYGVAGSSVIFGMNHLLNAFVLPNFSFQEAALQSFGAGLFGWYAADRTLANGGDFRRMIALHFWNNVTNLVLSYLIDPENTFLFRITIPVAFG